MSHDRLPAGSVKSAVRVFEIIEHLDEFSSGLALSDIARDLGYPVSSTAQLLKCMCDIGVVRRDRETRRYSNTPKLMMLGAAGNTIEWAKGSIYDVMNRLREFSGEVVSLGMRIGLSVNFICNFQSLNPQRVHVPPGLTVPLTTTAFGRLSLAQMGDQERQLLIRRLNAELDPKRRINDMEDVLEKIRRDGYAVCTNAEFDGWGMVAVTLPPSEQSIYLGIGAPSQVIEMKEAEFASALLRAVEHFQEVSEK